MSFESGVNSILAKLQQNIEKLKANGEDKNGKINTTGEKNQLAALLSGAKKEIENYSKNNAPDEDLPYSTYINRQYIIEKAKREIDAMFNAIKKSLRPYEEFTEDSTVKVSENAYVEDAHPQKLYKTSPDGSYEVISKEFSDGYVLTTCCDNTAHPTGRQYLYDKEGNRCTDPDKAATYFGLKAEKQHRFLGISWGDKSGRYYKKENLDSSYVMTYYKWDNQENMFTQVEATEHFMFGGKRDYTIININKMTGDRYRGFYDVNI